SPIRVRVVAADRPVFAYSHQLIDGGNGDGLVQRGEQHKLRVTVKNTGKGVAQEPTALLRNASGDGVVLTRARVEREPLKPGRSETPRLVVDVTSERKENAALIELPVCDAGLYESVVEKLRYPVHGESAGPAQASGWVRVSRDQAPVYEGASPSSGVIATAP